MNLIEDRPQRFGEALGATLWGATLYELVPAEESPYHWQFGEEEFLIVVGGRPTLRTPVGERVLEPWDVAWFVRGETGAHQVRNDADVSARVVIFSTCSDPEVVVYPDEGVVGFVADWSHRDRDTVSAKAAYEGRAEPRVPPRQELAIFNLLAGELDAVEERPGFSFRAARVGGRLGGELLGATLYETPPGEKLWPYHWESGCEEFLVVVAGRPTLRTPSGERELAPGDIVHFPDGEAGAHQLWNDTAEPFRVLIASTKAPLNVCGYPDSGKLLIDLPGRRRIVKDGPELDYWAGYVTWGNPWFPHEPPPRPSQAVSVCALRRERGLASAREGQSTESAVEELPAPRGRWCLRHPATLGPPPAKTRCAAS